MVILTVGDERGRLAALSLDDKVRLLTGADNWRTCPLPAIGLRAMVVSDGPAGVRGVTMDERNPASSLPCPAALGATWDPALVQALAATLGAEARSKGVDILLAPTINVMRTPLGGRGFESFGEDPALIARIAVAFVRGLHQAGVAAAVKGKKGSIGYVELLYALQNKGEMSFGLVENADGDYPEPTVESVTKAAEAKLKDIPDDLRFSLVNPPKGVKGAYPISGTTWAVCYVKQPKDKAKLLKDFLHWATHEGQDSCAEKHYARLPKGLVERVEKKLDMIKGE